MTEERLRQLAGVLLARATELIFDPQRLVAARAALAQALALPVGSARAALEAALYAEPEFVAWLDDHGGQLLDEDGEQDGPESCSWAEAEEVEDQWSGPTGPQSYAEYEGADGIYDGAGGAFDDAYAIISERGIIAEVGDGSAELYPLIDCPGVVAYDAEFDVTIGLAFQADRDVMSGALNVDVDEPSILDVIVTCDPLSLRLHGPARRTLRYVPGEELPTITVRFTALFGEDLAEERRIAVHYLRESTKIVGIAWRTLRVTRPEEVATSKPPPVRRRHLLDTAPLHGESPVDLLLIVYRPDTEPDPGTGRPAPRRYVWTAYAADPAIAMPDTDWSESLGEGEDPAIFARTLRLKVQLAAGTVGFFDWLAGRGSQIAGKIPDGVQSVIAQVAQAPQRDSPASVLLLTEEPYLPWELANLGLSTSFGGSSPFLGAHVAISRWPLTDEQPPVLTKSITIRRCAVVTADYQNGAQWPTLPQAAAEACELEQSLPAVVQVAAEYAAFRSCLTGDPAVDALHVALHGQIDDDDLEEGIILVEPAMDGGYAALAFGSSHVLGLSRFHGPGFIFINACQVGQAKLVLGEYTSLPVALLARGAGGVVAAIWKVDDAAARQVAVDFYRATRDDGASVAEALRRIRARFDNSPQSTPTLLAYQAFGHPHLILDFAGGGDND